MATRVRVDATEVVAGPRRCHWCGEWAETLYAYGIRYCGDLYWSRPLCGRECHDEAHG